MLIKCAESKAYMYYYSSIVGTNLDLQQMICGEDLILFLRLNCQLTVIIKKVIFFVFFYCF